MNFLYRTALATVAVALTAAVLPGLASADPPGGGEGHGNSDFGHSHGKGKGHGNNRDNNDDTNGLEILGDTCDDSDLPPHTGFQIAPACVDTEFGEVGAAEDNPQLLITDAPTEVQADTPFTLEVSTRNLVRDRFLGAADGGYYLESSFLNEDGLQRGHFHVACRVLPNLNEAPLPEPVPAFFQGVEDSGGGAEPDTVAIEVPGVPAGDVQCAAWAGDGSHRIPMMQRANQTPAFDTVRITVTAAE